MIDRGSIAGLLAQWQGRLRLGDWDIVIGPGEPREADQRSSVDIDANIHAAVVLLRGDTPDDQVERQIVHELLHVRLARIEDVYRQSLRHTPPAFDEVAAAMWRRAEESAIEALVDALTGSKRRDWFGSEPWVSAR